MPNFFDNIAKALGGDDNKNEKSKKGGKNNSSNNPIAKLQLPGQKFKGAGQSLGGAQPGKVIPVELPDPGPLGIKIEKRPNGGAAIVAGIIPGSQAERVGLQRGDCLCYAGTDGTGEISFAQFRELAKSSQRPLYLDIRRVPKTKGAAVDSASPAGAGGSADAYAKRQAVIAAAEAREKAAKGKNKPIKNYTASSSQLADNKQQQSNQEQETVLDDGPKSEASRQALLAAKQQEAELAAQLGYNPYETNKVTSGQARNATVTIKNGVIVDKDGAGTVPGSNGSTAAASSSSAVPPGAVAAPKSPAEAVEEGGGEPVSVEFEQAFESMVTSGQDENKVIASLGILRKLIVNATTKGQATSEDGADDAACAKFRRVRLANEKINDAVVECTGALDVLLSTGFVLTEQDGESVLVFPAGDKGPDWLPAALAQMEAYETSGARVC